jgi:thiol:disulfide interchange protein
MLEHDGGTVVRFDFTVPPEHTLYADKLRFELQGGGALENISIPEPSSIVDPVTGHEKKGYQQSFAAEYKVATPLPLDLVIRFQGCSNSACYFPERHYFTLTTKGVTAQADPSVAVATPSPTSAQPADSAGANTPTTEGFKIAGRETGYMSKTKFLGFLESATTGGGSNRGMLARLGELGLAATLGLILLGGLGLNLTPCVLPMIPINLAIIGAGAGASSRQRGFGLGACYGAGMTLVYGVLGLVVVLTGSKFGTLNSSIWFNVGIAAVFVLLGLAMFDLVNIDFSRFQGGMGGRSRSQRGQFLLAFTLGSVAALLAGACVAPVVISVLLLATNLYGKGVVAGLLLPFVLGLGMALPWPFAGAGLSFLPKPGKWMTKIKHGFGVAILVFAAYYGHIAYGLFSDQHALRVQAREPSEGQKVAASSPNERLAKALELARTQGRPLFIDFAASWCKNCTAMDATVFSNAEVKERLKSFVAVRYDAEQPNDMPAKAVLDQFGVMGLPTYLVLTPAKSAQ